MSKILFLRRSDRKFMVVCFCTDDKINITESWWKGKHFVAILCPNLDFILLSLWSTLVSFSSLYKQKEVSINLLVKDLTELIYWACCILLECSLFTYCLRSCFFLFWITCVCTTFSHEKYKHKTPMLFQEPWGCSNIFYIWFASLKGWRRMNCFLTRRKYKDN